MNKEYLKSLNNTDVEEYGLTIILGTSLCTLQRLLDLFDGQGLTSLYSTLVDDYPSGLELICSLAEIHEHVKKEDAESDL